jgi:tetratricopeptide (TPR) repeat protein
MDPNPQDMPDLMGKHDPLGDAITVALVLVTLFGALIAWRQASAHFEHDEATVRAEEWTVLASSQRTRAKQAEQLQLSRQRLVQRNALNAKDAFGRAIFGRGDPTLMALEARHWRERARETAAGSRRLARDSAVEMQEIQAGAAPAFPDIDPGLGLTAPCAPPSPPHRDATIGMEQSRGPPPADGYPAQLQREAFRLEGRRAAAAATAVGAEEQFTRYAASLALIAVSLFFFGYALTKYGFRFRRGFALLALLLTLFSAFLAVRASLDAPPKPDPAAAAAYADGQVAFERGDFQTAVENFACATRLNPHLAEAFLQQSQAFDQRGMPLDASVINESLQNPGNLRKALAYARKARKLDPEDPQALNQIATALFVDGVVEHDRRKLIQALALHRRHEEAVPRSPIPAFNSATTLLALGGPWEEGYRKAERLLAASSQPFAYVGGALTDLDFLEGSHLRDGLAAAVREAKEQVVAAGMARVLGDSDSDPPAGGDRATASGVRLRMTPVAAYLRFRANGLRVDRDHLFVALYRHEQRGWQEMQSLSGHVVPAPVQGGYIAALWSTPTASCLSGGSYKVELYVNGRLANDGHLAGATVHLPHLVRRRLPGMNLYLCDPGRSWQRIPRRAAGLLDGFERRGPTGREGIVVFDISASPPRTFPQLFPTLQTRFSPPLPGGLEPAGPPPGLPFIGNLTQARLASYTYPNGRMVLATARTPIGRKLAIAVFGPSTFFARKQGPTPPLGHSLLESLYTYDY